MLKIILDTNCLLAFVTDRNKKQTEIIYGIFEKALNSELTIYIISNVITEFVYVMDKIYNIKNEEINEIVRDLIETPNVEFHPGYFPDIIFKIWPQKIKDYGDAVLSAASIQLSVPVYTFDKKFSKQLSETGCKSVLLK